MRRNNRYHPIVSHQPLSNHTAPAPTDNSNEQNVRRRVKQASLEKPRHAPRAVKTKHVRSCQIYALSRVIPYLLISFLSSYTQIPSYQNEHHPIKEVSAVKNRNQGANEPM